MHGLDTIVAMNNARQEEHDRQEVEALQARLEKLQAASVALVEKIGELQEKVDYYEMAQMAESCCGKCQGGDQ